MTDIIDVRPAATRDHTKIDWLDSRHSFSFGPHWDPTNTGHGLLVVSNDDRVRAGSGFSTHPHRDMEIVTWVLDGELEHADSERNRGVIYPGLAQRMSAGHGIRHSEINHSAHEDVHFVQMWVLPDTASVAPGYEQLDVNDQLAAGGLVPVASGRDHDAAIRIHQRGATLWVGRLRRRRVGRRCPMRRSCTSSSAVARWRWKAPAAGRGRRRPAHRRRLAHAGGRRQRRRGAGVGDGLRRLTRGWRRGKAPDAHGSRRRRPRHARTREERIAWSGWRAAGLAHLAEAAGQQEVRGHDAAVGQVVVGQPPPDRLGGKAAVAERHHERRARAAAPGRRRGTPRSGRVR